MSDTRPTPETDAAEVKQNVANQGMPDKDWPWLAIKSGWDFARNLERERDKALRELQEARNTNVNVRKERGARVLELKNELQTARAALSGRTVSCSQCNESAKRADSKHALWMTELRKVTELEADVAELNQRLIDRTADMLTKVVELEEKIRHIKKSHEETERDEIEAMREWIKEAQTLLIAACSNNAEAGWESTRILIAELMSLYDRMTKIGVPEFACKPVEKLLTQWPLELLATAKV